MRANQYAKNKCIASLAFDQLGRRLGMMLVIRCHWAKGLRGILNPISLVRYFEFDFCLRQLPDMPRTILDVSSPMLFPLYLATRLPDTSFELLNPDPSDVEMTRYCTILLGLRNVETHNQAVHGLLGTHKGAVDYISSISVIEHIAGEYDDTRAISFMLEYLKPGGVLALTVPLSEDKQHRDEYLPDGRMPYEGTHNVRREDGRFFYQRLYTEESINERLLSRLNGRKVHMEWWGEREKGFYKCYSSSSAYNQGYDCKAFADNFTYYASYDEMPGSGICGIKITN